MTDADDQQALHVLREVALGEGPIDFTAPNGQKVRLTSDRDRLSFIAGGLAAFLAGEQATRQSARADALRGVLDVLRKRAAAKRLDGQATAALALDGAVNFLESLASDNEGKADGNGG